MNKYKINMTDKNNNAVYEGDVFYANLISPSLFPATKVSVVKDVSTENLNIDRDFDVEDEDGNRIWNAYMVIKYGERNKPEEIQNNYLEAFNKQFKEPLEILTNLK